MNPETLQTAGLWIGLVLSLSLFSLFLGQQWHSRLMQYVFAGALTGWIMVLAWQRLVQPRMIAPLAQGDMAAAIPIAASVLLALGALARTGHPVIFSRRLGTWLIRLASPIGTLLVASALATGLVGIWQGTIWPQILTAVSTAYWLPIALILTLAVLFEETAAPALWAQLPAPVASGLQGLVRFSRPLLWLASGMILARLITSRITLLTAFLARILAAVRDTGLLDWLQALLA